MSGYSRSSSTSLVHVPYFYLGPYEPRREHRKVGYETCLLCITLSTSTHAFKNSQEVQMSKMLRKGVGVGVGIGIQSSLMRSVILAHFMPT